MVLLRFSFREAATRPGRAALTLASIVIGVAAVVSVTIATSTARSAYQNMFAAVTGKAAVEVVADSGGAFDEGVLALVEQVPGAKAAPIIQRPTVMYFKDQRVKLVAMGVDPARDRAVRDYDLDANWPLGVDNAVLLEADFAGNMRVRAGDEIGLLTRNGVQPMTVVGLLESQGPATMRLSGMVFMPLSLAQSVFHAEGQIDAIQVVLDESADEGEVTARVAGVLPAGVSVRRPVTRTQILEQTLVTIERALGTATAFSLLLAAFIIFNTFLMNVGERRRKLAILRVIGATRRQISRLLLAESLAMGVLGTLVGIVVGLLGADLLTQALNQTLLVTLPPTRITPVSLILAVVFGLGVALLGVIVPARRAGRLTPLEGISDVAHGDIEGASRWSTVVGAILCLASGLTVAACIVGWLPVSLAIIATVCLLLGAVLLLQAVLGGLFVAALWLIFPLRRIESLLVGRQLLRHRTRSGLTVGVLFVASTTGIGLASAMLDSIRDVEAWYDRTIVGDFFVRATMPDMATGVSADIPDAFGAELRRIRGITIDTARFVQARVVGEPVVIIVRGFSTDKPVNLDLKQGDPERLAQQLVDGEVVIGTVLAQRTGLTVGDELPLGTSEGATRLRIAGVTNEYLVGGFAVYMERKVARRLLGVDGVDAYVIQAEPQDLGDVRLELEDLCNKYGLLLHSSADMSRLIDGTHRGVDACLWGILVLGFVMAAFGVVNTLTMNVLEQTRELGLLRMVGMTRWQVRRTILAQAATIGGAGLFLGSIAGLGMTYLINLATMPALGHPVEFTFRPLVVIGWFAGALAMVIVAAWLPAERAARLELLQALQYE
jgi:putative ABC transport system permease protein